MSCCSGDKPCCTGKEKSEEKEKKQCCMTPAPDVVEDAETLDEDATKN